MLMGTSAISPVPLLALFPVHVMTDPGTQDESIILAGEPEQIESVGGFGVTIGTRFTVTVFAVKPVTELPQESLMTGGGTFNEVTLPHVVGHPGIVNGMETTVPVLVQVPGV